MATDIELAHLALPIANETNKQLEGEVATRKKEIDKLDGQIEQYQDRVQIIKDHLKNVRQELQLTQVSWPERERDLSLSHPSLLQLKALYDARRNDLQTESHLKQLGESLLEIYTLLSMLGMSFYSFYSDSWERRG